MHNMAISTGKLPPKRGDGGYELFSFLFICHLKRWDVCYKNIDDENLAEDRIDKVSTF